MAELHLVFDGLCLLVPHADEPRAVVVVPDGREQRPDHVRYGRDGLELRNHVAFLDFDLADVVGGDSYPPKTSAVFRFDRHRIRVRTGASGTLDTSGLDDWVANLDRIVPQLKFDERCLAEQPGGETCVVAQILIDAGSFPETGMLPSGPWEFPDLLEPTQTFWGQLSPKYTCVAPLPEGRAVFEIEAFDGSGRQELELAPHRGDGVVEVRVANACAGELFDFDELAIDPPPVQFDEDFRHFYNLFHAVDGSAEGEAAFWSAKLAGAKLPIPTAAGGGGGSTTGACIGGYLDPRAYQLK